MKKFAIITAVAASMAIPAAYAGFHATSFVSIYKSGNNSGTAAGSLNSARYYSTDSFQYIGCTAASDLKSSIYISCAARNAASVILTCYSTTANQQAREAVSAVNSTSAIYFQADSSGKCTYITVGNYSYSL